MIRNQNRTRPKTLCMAAMKGRETDAVDASIREFLDEFYIEKDTINKETMLFDEPPLIDDDKSNAYFAAIAEHLSFKYNLNVPDWCLNKARFLRRPFFPCGLESLKATLLVQSPVAFRRRMIFVDADPLYRPRRDSVGIGMTS